MNKTIAILIGILVFAGAYWYVSKSHTDDQNQNSASKETIHTDTTNTSTNEQGKTTEVNNKIMRRQLSELG